MSDLACLSPFDSIVAEIQAFTAELEVDTDGVGYMGVMALSTLCGVSKQALLSLDSARPGLFARIKSNKHLPECLKPFAGFDYWRSNKIPEALASAIIYFYAVESRNTNVKAKQTLQALFGHTVKELIRLAKELGCGSSVTCKPVLNNDTLMSFVYSFERPVQTVEIANHFEVSMTTARDWANKLQALGYFGKIKIKSTGQLVYAYHNPNLDFSFFPINCESVNTLRVEDSSTTLLTTVLNGSKPSLGTFYKDFLDFVNRYEFDDSTKLKLIESVLTI